MRISDWSSDVCSSDLSDTAWRISACTRSPPPTDQNGKKKNKFLLRKFQTMTGYFKSARRFLSFLFSVEKRPMWMRISRLTFDSNGSFQNGDKTFLPQGSPAPDRIRHFRSEERRVGKECGSTVRSRW